MAEPAEHLAAQGFAVFVLHYLDRTGPVEASKGAMVRHFPAWMKVLWDGVSFVHQRSEVDGDKTAYFGFSLGAYLALASASIDGRITAVVECFGGLPKEMKFFMRRLCPVLILHGEDDQICPIDTTGRMAVKLLKNGSIKTYPGYPHGMATIHADVLNPDILAFIRT